MNIDDDSPGPDPDSLEAVDQYPAEATPMQHLSITYTSNNVDDYVQFHRSGNTVSLALGPVVFSGSENDDS